MTDRHRDGKTEKKGKGKAVYRGPSARRINKYAEAVIKGRRLSKSKAPRKLTKCSEMQTQEVAQLVLEKVTQSSEWLCSIMPAPMQSAMLNGVAQAIRSIVVEFKAQSEAPAGPAARS